MRRDEVLEYVVVPLNASVASKGAELDGFRAKAYPWVR